MKYSDHRITSVSIRPAPSGSGNLTAFATVKLRGGETELRHIRIYDSSGPQPKIEFPGFYREREGRSEYYYNVENQLYVNMMHAISEEYKRWRKESSQ